MKFKSCIVHIGTEKTGTTTLQHYLAKNRSALFKQGIFFPESLGKSEHVDLVLYALNSRRLNGPRVRQGANTPAKVRKHRREITERFDAEIQHLSDDLTLLLSCERLHSQITHESEMKRVTDFLTRYADTFRIIIYLRPQHEVAVSMYSTALKNGSVRKNVLPNFEAPGPLYDYAGSIDRWGSAFGRENITPRIFGRTDFQGGDLCEDFVKILGLDASAFENVPRLNESVGATAQIFMRMINEHIPRHINKQPNLLRADLFKLIADGQAGSGLKPARADAERFFALFTEGNERIRREWFPERNSLFEVDFSNYPEAEDTRTLSLTEAFEIFCRVWMEKQRKFLKLQRRENKFLRNEPEDFDNNQNSNASENRPRLKNMRSGGAVDPGSSRAHG